MSNIEQLANKLSAANSSEVAKKHHRKKHHRKKHRRKLEESSHNSEKEEEKELRKKKKKEKEKTRTREDLATTPTKDKDDLERVKILKKKEKKRHAEHEEEQAGSNSEKQHKKARLDPLLSSNINSENKKKRKRKSSSGVSEVVLQKTKHRSQTREHRDKCHQRNQTEDDVSCNQGTDNMHVCLEPSTLEKSGGANSSSGSFLESSTRKERQHKKKKKRQKEKERKRGTENIHVCLEPSTFERPDDADSFLQVDTPLESRKERQLKKKRKKEKNKTGRDVTMMETTYDRNDDVLDGNEVIVHSRVETTSNNTKKRQDNEKLREAIVHANTIHQRWTVSKERLKELREKGIKVKIGKWSFQELGLLQSNMDNFLKIHDLEDPGKILLYSSTDKEESRFWKRFARTNDFYKELGKGILRSSDSIYRCAKRFYDTSNYIGKYSDEEIEELRRLHAIHEGDWVTVGQLLGRSRMSVNRKHSKLPTTRGTSGMWTDNELKHLKEAVYVITNTAVDQPAPCHGIYWPGVAQIVKTRNSDQCRRKWLERLCWMEDDNEKQWTKQNELRLITRLYNSGVTEDCDIDWIQLQSEFKNNYHPQWLRKKWLQIKRKAPNYHQLDFEEIVDYLYKNINSSEV